MQDQPLLTEGKLKRPLLQGQSELQATPKKKETVGSIMK